MYGYDTPVMFRLVIQDGGFYKAVSFSSRYILQFIKTICWVIIHNKS